MIIKIGATASLAVMLLLIIVCLSSFIVDRVPRFQRYSEKVDDILLGTLVVTISLVIICGIRLIIYGMVKIWE